MKHIQIDGKWRITDDEGKVLKNAKGQPLDMGGHEQESESIYHAEFFNVTDKKKIVKKKSSKKK